MKGLSLYITRTAKEPVSMSFTITYQGKEATFENEKGTVLLILLNTYSPTMSVRYSTSTTQD